jgi:hypothetical protein
VLGRDTVAAPPEDSPSFNDIVQPGFADLFGGEIGSHSMLFECSDEGECAGDIVVDHDTGKVELLVDIVVDGSEFLQDVLIGPAFEWPAEVDTNQLSKNASVDFVKVIFWY